MRRLVLILSIVAVTGCTKKSALYCEHHLDDTENCPPPDMPGQMACMNDTECSTGACDVLNRVCVECNSNDQCTMEVTRPVCSTDHHCDRCVMDTDCASQVCLPTGACAPTSNVIYASATTGVGTAGCGVNPTTNLCTFAQAVIEVASARNVIKLATGAYTVTGSSGQALDDETTIDARGSTITHTGGNGTVLTVRATGKVTIYGGTISGATGSGADGVKCEAGGAVTVLDTMLTSNAGSAIDADTCDVHATLALISANAGVGVVATGGSVVIERSKFLSNSGGGLSLTGSGKFQIVGNWFYANGSITGAIGGLTIMTAEDASNRLEFNTFRQNSAQVGTGGGVHCQAGAFVARNNILSENGGPTNMEQLSGSCTHQHSLVRPGALPPGTGNSAADAMFAPGTGNLHVMPGSPAVGAADPMSVLTGIAARDLDGDPRTSPAEIGADELP